MFTLKEVSSIIVTILVLAVTFGLIKDFDSFLVYLGTLFLVFTINILAKKLAAYSLDSEIELKFWEIGRWGYKKHQKFEKKFPAGLFFPIIVAGLTLGTLQWMACLVFDVKAKVYRAAKRHGIYSFSEMTERHIGLIAIAGITANLIFAIFGYFTGFPIFSRLNLFLAFFNIIPISELDGNKIFFGNSVLWSFLAAIIMLGLLATIFII